MFCPIVDAHKKGLGCECDCCCSYGLNLFLLSIDEGISGYRDDSLETVKRNEETYGIPLKVLTTQHCGNVLPAILANTLMQHVPPQQRLLVTSCNLAGRHGSWQTLSHAQTAVIELHGMMLHSRVADTLGGANVWGNAIQSMAWAGLSVLQDLKACSDC